CAAEELVIDKIVIEECDGKRRNQFIDIRCVKNELTMNNGKRKKNKIISKMNEKNANRKGPDEKYIYLIFKW
ncbi:4643_t:CDS:1, partial [Racocetra persica]